MIYPGPLLANEALNALAAHVAVLDRNGVIVFVNDAWSRFARTNGGVPESDAYVGVNYLSVCQAAVERGDARARAPLAGLEEVLRGDRDELALEYPCDAPDRQRWFRMSATRFGSEPDICLVVAHEEITAQKENERALQATERLLRSVLEALPIGVWIMDPSGRIVQGNAAGIRVWAGARYVGPDQFGEYKGRWLDTGKPITADEWAGARAIRKGEVSIDEEIEIECFDGTRKIILNSALPLFDEERRIAGAIIVNQDITARKQAEAEREELLREQRHLRLEALEAVRMKEDFIATLSHELRTPLQSVLGWASLLNRALPDTAAAERAAAAVERNARTAVQLLNDTLDMSRIARGKLTMEESDVDLAALVSEVVDTMRPAALEKKVSFEEQMCDEPLTVPGDPTRLQQVVWNLLSNALKFTPAGGRIEVGCRPEGEWAEVRVHDTGVGIPPAFMPFLFDRFRQAEGAVSRSKLGLGIGLAIVKEIVGLHGGTIAAESPGEGQGATFTVRLPRAASGSIKGVSV